MIRIAQEGAESLVCHVISRKREIIRLSRIFFGLTLLNKPLYGYLTVNPLSTFKSTGGRRTVFLHKWLAQSKRETLESFFYLSAFLVVVVVLVFIFMIMSR